MKNYYDILGISSNSTDEEIKVAYRKLSQKLHPDKNDSDIFFDEMFKNINEAYSILSDKNSKLKYDLSLTTLNTNKHKEVEKEILEYDALCIDAIALILVSKQASTSFLQLKLSIGYNRAGRIIDQLHDLGIIGEYNGTSFRSILVDKQRAFDLLNKQVVNFFKTEFLEKYEIYNTKISSTNSNNQTSNKNYSSIWEEVKQWRRVKNVLWVINIVLILYILIIPKNSFKTNNSGYYSTGKINAYNGLNLRREPNSNSIILTSIPYESSVKILNKMVQLRAFQVLILIGLRLNMMECRVGFGVVM